MASESNVDRPNCADRAIAKIELGQSSGARDPDEAAQALPLIPRHRLHCRRVKIGSRRHSGKGPRAAERFLFEALVLGRCSETFYDPCKPVIWTNNRLNRGLALYTPDRFLDED